MSLERRQIFDAMKGITHMSGESQQTAKEVTHQQIFALGGALGQRFLSFATKVGNREEVQCAMRVVQSGELDEQIEACLLPLLQAAGRGELKKTQELSWPDPERVYYDEFGLSVNSDRIGITPPAKNNLQKLHLVPLPSAITMESIIIGLRRHYDVNFETSSDQQRVLHMDSQSEPRKGAHSEQNAYYIRLDVTKGQGLEYARQGAGQFFSDPNKVPMTLREFLLTDFFFWLATGKKDHIDSDGTVHVCAGSKIGGSHVYTVKTTSTSITIGTVRDSKFDSTTRLRRVAIEPENVR